MRFNKRIFNISAWITLLITYILPPHNTGEFATNFGYPFGYLTIYDVPLNRTLFSSCSINILGLLLNIIITYFVIYFGRMIFHKIKKLHDNK